MADLRRFNADGTPRDGVVAPQDEEDHAALPPLPGALRAYEACPLGQRMMVLLPRAEQGWVDLALDPRKLAGREVVFSIEARLVLPPGVERLPQPNDALDVEVRFVPRRWLWPRGRHRGRRLEASVPMVFPARPGRIEIRWRPTTPLAEGILRVTAVTEIADLRDLVATENGQIASIVISDGALGDPPPPATQAAALLAARRSSPP